MIFYFSGTGNSKHVAFSMSDENRISIGEAMKSGSFTYEATDGEAVGFIMPVYYSGIPKTVLDFIKKLKLTGNIDYIYGILTHGGGPGGAGTMLQKSLSKKGYHLDACFDVKMTSNYIMFGDLRPDERIKDELEAAKPVIQKIKESVDNREKILPDWSAVDGFLTSCMKVLCDKNMSVKGFHADEGCTGCGMCVNNCPSGLIKMKDGKPVWTENKCVRCMACLKCPHVQFNDKSSERRRYSYEKYSKM